MMNEMFIPQKLKVGFVNRTGTFTGKLAYVIYYDNKGILRKETSWQSWRDKSIEPVEIDNTPVKGFVINKDVQRDGYWGSGRSMVRIHHPDNFEFEITVDNLIGILMHGDCNNRELQQECVFAWLGTELVLLPTNSVEYQKSLEFTTRQDLKVSAKELIRGATYQKRKDSSVYVYLGYFEWFDGRYQGNDKVYESKGKKHLFAYQYSHGSAWYINPVSVNTLSHCIEEQVHEKYPELIEQFQKTVTSSPVVEFQRIAIKDALEKFGVDSLNLFFAENDTEYQMPRNFYVGRDNRWFLTDYDGPSIIECKISPRAWTVHKHRPYYHYTYTNSRYSQKTIMELKEDFKPYNIETISTDIALDLLSARGLYCLVGVLENGNEVLF